MSDSSRAELRRVLVANYEKLGEKLARRLGSSDFAHDALQDTYVRLEDAAQIGPVRSPKDYLFRIALNIAADHRRAEARRLTDGEVDALLYVADEAPSPAQIVESRSELDALTRALAELPERRRQIFRAVLIDKVPRRDVAKRFGISSRTVDFEIQRALEHGELHLKRNLNKGFDTDPSESST